MSKNLEIERKFLVKSTDFKNESISRKSIIQGFLSLDPERTVRVRISGIKAWITIKGASNESGTTRVEVEEEISFEKASLLMTMCLPGVIHKIRYIVPNEDKLFEVDVFLKDNHGLIVAEIELDSEEDEIDLPEWIGKEVTGDVNYYNSQLSINPYINWK